MLGRSLAILLASLIYLAVGCQPEPENPWVEDSPFRPNNGPPKDAGVLIVTCDFYPLELPGNIDLTSLPALAPLLSDPCTTDSSSAGRQAAFGRIYRRNGMLAGMASVAQWPLIREQIIQSGGVGLGRTTRLLRKPSDIAECITTSIDKPQTLFAQHESGPRGYTIGPGNCAFHVSIQPAPEEPTTNPMQLRLVPVFSTLADEPHSRRRLRSDLPTPGAQDQIVFHEAAASISVPQDSFILIAHAPDEGQIANVGKTFLRAFSADTHAQRVLIIVPAVRTAQQVRRTWQAGQQSVDN